MASSSDRTPKKIHHYTSLENFKSILEKRELWASHYLRLKHQVEIGIGLERPQGEIRMGLEMVRKSLPDPPSTMEERLLAEFLDYFIKDDLRIFVGSFTTERDSESHWREYAEDGVEIGFISDRLLKNANKPLQKEKGDVTADCWELLECVYLHPKDKQDLEQLKSQASLVIDTINNESNELKRSAWGLPLASIRSQLERKCCAIKFSESYKWEKEWRFIITKSSCQEDTYKLGFSPQDTIEEVLVSPFGDKKQRRTAVEGLLDSLGLNLTVLESQLN